MRSSIRITKLGISFLGLIALFYYFSLVSEIGLLFIVIGIFLGCYAVNVLSGFNNIRKISITLTQSIRLQERQKSSSFVEIRNHSKYEKKFLTIKSKFGILCMLNSIKGKEVRHLSPDVTLAGRGVYPIDYIKVESTYPFGLFAVSRKLSVKSELIVYPAVYECAPPRAAGFETAFGGSFTGKNRSTHGSNFSGIRPYQSFDSVRSIHWKSSSKGQGLMVKEFFEELSGKISFIIFNEEINLTDGDTVYNCALRCVSSLILAALEAGHSAEVLDIQEKRVINIPPFTQPDLILEYFARLDKYSNLPETRNFHDTLSLLAKTSSICLTAPSISKNVIRAINGILQERRFITLYLPDNSLKYKTHAAKADERDISVLSEKGIRILYYAQGGIL